MGIKHLLSYIVRGTCFEALRKLLEVTPPPPTKTERHTLQDILANVLVSWLYLSAKDYTLYERLLYLRNKL